MPLDRPPGQQLGLGPRHEDPGPDFHLDGTEGRCAEQVLQRLAPFPPPQQQFERRPLLGVDRLGKHELSTSYPEDVRQQLVGVGLG